MPSSSLCASLRLSPGLDLPSYQGACECWSLVCLQAEWFSARSSDGGNGADGPTSPRACLPLLGMCEMLSCIAQTQGLSVNNIVNACTSYII